MQWPLPGASSLCKLSLCMHIQVWDELEVSQKHGPCRFPGLVQGACHFSASIQPICGSWPFFGTKAQLMPHLHQPHLLMGSRSCLTPAFGVCWGSHGFLISSLSLQASAWRDVVAPLWSMGPSSSLEARRDGFAFSSGAPVPAWHSQKDRSSMST